MSGSKTVDILGQVCRHQVQHTVGLIVLSNLETNSSPWPSTDTEMTQWGLVWGIKGGRFHPAKGPVVSSDVEELDHAFKSLVMSSKGRWPHQPGIM